MDEEAAETPTERSGIIAGIGAYSLWGLFPLVFALLDDVDPLEVVGHRVVWSLVVVVVVLAWRGPRRWLRPLLADRRQLGRLVAASVLISTNWLVYIWAVTNGNVVEAALGYYVNPLLTVALGIVLLGERLRRAQVVALCFGAASVVVLTAAAGRLPWIALVLALSFAGYGFQKKAVEISALPSLAVETAVLAPFATALLVVLQLRGTAAFASGPVGRDALLLTLGVVTAVPLLLFATAAQRVPLTMLGLLQYLTPTLQLLCGVVVLGETLSPARLAGFVLVWIALALLAVDAVRALRGRAGAEEAALPVQEPA